MYNVAILKPDSAFAPIFPKGVPIINCMVPTRVKCGGDGPCAVCFIDLAKLSEDQFHTVAKMVHEQCDPSVPLVQAISEIRARGLPLRAKHIASIQSNSMAFL